MSAVNKSGDMGSAQFTLMLMLLQGMLLIINQYTKDQIRAKTRQML